MYVMCVRKHSPSHLPNTDIKSLTQTTSHMYVTCATKHSPSHLPYTDIKSLTQTSSHMYVMCATKHSPSHLPYTDIKSLTQTTRKKRRNKNFISITCYIFISIHFLNTRYMTQSVIEGKIRKQICLYAIFPY